MSTVFISLIKLANISANIPVNMSGAHNNLDEILHCINFAAIKHKEQRRKDPDKTPYINHPIGTPNKFIPSQTFDKSKSQNGKIMWRLSRKSVTRKHSSRVHSYKMYTTTFIKFCQPNLEIKD